MDDPDRWFDTPAMYSRAEAQEIKRLMAEGRTEIYCPRCEQLLLFGTPIRQRDKVITQVRCPECNRSVIIREQVAESG
jgi:hypothetical protein